MVQGNIKIVPDTRTTGSLSGCEKQETSRVIWRWGNLLPHGKRDNKNGPRAKRKNKRTRRGRVTGKGGKEKSWNWGQELRADKPTYCWGSKSTNKQKVEETWHTYGVKSAQQK